MKDKRTSYRAKPTRVYGEVGYTNVWGGFHGTTDPYAYIGLIVLWLKNLRNKGTRRWLRRMIWDRWRHRRCDTLDFHHQIYCTLDPWVRKRDAQDRWKEVWKDAHR